MRLATSVLAAALALPLAGLARPAAADEPVKVRIAWVVPIGNWASIILEKKDVMKHYGQTYTIEPVRFQSTPTMISALAAGELEIADLAYSSFAIAVENAGMTGLRVIADEAQDGANGYYSGEYFVLNDGPVKTIDDLKGKVLATVGAGSAIDIPVRVILRKHGLEDRRDYTVVEGPFPNLPAMLLDKKVDFIPSVPPFSLNPKLQQLAHPLFTVKDALGGPTEFIIWAAQNSFLQQHRAAMVDLMEDTVRAVHFFVDQKNHAETVQIAAKLIKQPPENLDWVFTKQADYQDPNMLPNMETFQRAIDLQQEMGFLKTKLDAKQYTDLSIVKEAAARIK